MRLRPYKSCDAKTIEKWINDKGVFQKFYNGTWQRLVLYRF